MFQALKLFKPTSQKTASEMLTREQEEKLSVAKIIAALCAYEFIALCSKNARIPTISRISWTVNQKWWGKLVIWSALGWLTDHLMIAPMAQGLNNACANCSNESNLV